MLPRTFLCVIVVCWTALPTVAEPVVDRHGDPLPEGAVARLGTVRLRHAEMVMSVAFAPDGKTIASAGRDNRVCLWDVATGKEIRVFAHELSVESVAFSPDGKQLATASGDGVYLWSVATGKQLRALKGDENEVLCVAFSPDGKFLASGGRREVRLWDLSKGQPRRLLKQDIAPDGFGSPCRSVAFSPDGKTLASGAEDKLIHLWDVPTGKEIRSLRGHTQRVLGVAFAPDGKSIASVGDTFPHSETHELSPVRHWDLATGKELPPFKGLRNAFTMMGVWSVSYAPDGKQLATAYWENLIEVVDVPTRKVVQAIEVEAPVWCVSYSRDGKKLAAAVGPSVILWDSATFKEIHPAHGHRSEVCHVEFAPDGQHIATASHGGVKLWDDGGKQVQTWRNTYTVPMFAPDGKRLALQGYLDRGSVIALHDRATGQLVENRKVGASFGAWSLAFLPGDKIAVAGLEYDKGAWLHEPGADKPVMLKTEEPARLPMALSSDGRFLAVNGEKFALQVLDLKTRKQVLSLAHRYEERLTAVALSPDGELLATAHFDLSVRLSVRATGKELHRMRIEKWSVKTLAFSRDGRRLAAANEDGTIHIWETITGSRIAVLRSQGGMALTVAFSPDGKRLVSGSSNSTALVWDLARTSADQHGVDRLFTELGHADAARGYQAINDLAAQPGQAVARLQEQVRAVSPIDRRQLDKLITGLDDEEFSVRQDSLKGLDQLGDLAVPALKKVLAGNPSAETRRRAEELLPKIEFRALAGDQLQTWRAIEVLERIDTPAARQLLATLAEGAPEHRVTTAAQAALARLSK
ncbi:MAG: hypothetical protein AB7K24_02290 [Gemmataceae bacterium]